jgi:hypothetical protein
VDHAEAREILELAAVEPGGLARLMAGDTPEASALAGHLAGCADCTQEMAHLRRVAGIVRGVVRTTPPPELRERTLAFVRAVGRDRSPATASPATASAATASVAMGPGPAIRRGTMVAPAPAAATAPSRAARPDRSWRRLAMAAVIALAVGGTTVAVIQTLAVRQQEEAVSDLATVTAWTLRVSAQPDARRVDLTASNASGQYGMLVFSPATRELVVVAMGLPNPPAGHEFRCWVESGGTRQAVGKMFFGGGVSYWVGRPPAVSGLSGRATFGVSLVDLASPAAQSDPVLVGEL